MAVYVKGPKMTTDNFQVITANLATALATSTLKTQAPATAFPAIV